MLTLASTSAARRALFSAAGIEAQLANPGLDEALVKPALIADGLSPRDIADALAELKAVKVSKSRDGLVLGADQTLDLAGVLVDKAPDLESLRAQLLALRGRRHKLHSALVAAQNGIAVWRVVKTASLEVRDFSDAWLDAYLERNGANVLGAVGGYHLEGEGVQLFSALEGDYFTVLGLPLIELLDFLRLRGEIAS